MENRGQAEEGRDSKLTMEGRPAWAMESSCPWRAVERGQDQADGEQREGRIGAGAVS